MSWGGGSRERGKDGTKFSKGIMWTRRRRQFWRAKQMGWVDSGKRRELREEDFEGARAWWDTTNRENSSPETRICFVRLGCWVAMLKIFFLLFFIYFYLYGLPVSSRVATCASKERRNVRGCENLAAWMHIGYRILQRRWI